MISRQWMLLRTWLSDGGDDGWDGKMLLVRFGC